MRSTSEEESKPVCQHETSLGRIVGVYPRLIQRMEARMLELLGSAGSVVLMQEGETYMATIIEAVETKYKPKSKRDSITILTDELRDTGWGNYEFDLSEMSRKTVVLQGTDLPYEHGSKPTYFWFMLGMLKVIVEWAFEAKINIKKSEWLDRNRVRVELEIDGRTYLGPASKTL